MAHKGQANEKYTHAGGLAAENATNWPWPVCLSGGHCDLRPLARGLFLTTMPSKIMKSSCFPVGNTGLVPIILAGTFSRVLLRQPLYFIIGVVVTGSAAIIGSWLGLLAGYYPMLDNIIIRGIDIFMGLLPCLLS